MLFVGCCLLLAVSLFVASCWLHVARRLLHVCRSLFDVWCLLHVCVLFAVCCLKSATCVYGLLFDARCSRLFAVGRVLFVVC